MNEEVRTGGPVAPGADGDTGAAESEAAWPSFLSALLNAVDVGVVLLDATRRVTATNQAFVAMANLGVPPEKLVATALPCGPASYAHLYARPDAVRQWADRTIERGVPAADQVEAADGGLLQCGYRPVFAEHRLIGHCWTLRRVTEPAAAEQPPNSQPPTGQTASGQPVSRQPGSGQPISRQPISSQPISGQPTGGRPADGRPATERADFAAAIAHEVRTPATSVAAFTGMLIDPDLDAESRTRVTNAVLRNAERMQLLASDLFRLAELDRRPAPGRSADDLDAPPPVDIPAAVERAAARLERPVEIVAMQTGHGVPADADLLTEALATALSVLAGLAEDATVTVGAWYAPGDWTVEASVPVDREVTTEQLLALRVRHPRDAEALQTGALSMIMSRAVATSLGGSLTARTITAEPAPTAPEPTAPEPTAPPAASTPTAPPPQPRPSPGQPAERAEQPLAAQPSRRYVITFGLPSR